MAETPFKKLDFFFNQFKPFFCKKHQLILRAGNTPYGIFYIRRGFARQYLISQDGKELTTIIYKPKDLFPIKWAIANSPIKSYFESMTAMELVRAPREDFLSFIRDEPEVFLQLVSRIVNRLDAILERMQYLAFGTAHVKVASLILILAERFGKKFRKKIMIQLPLTHNDIASLLGLTRETVSVEMHKFRQAKIIMYHGHQLIINIEKLKKEAHLNSS